MLEIKNLSQVFGTRQVLNNISLTVSEGEFVSLLGPSGCGKTSLLRIIAGHDRPMQGQVFLEGKDITQVKSHKRPIHTVFQRYALFPHMNVYDNVAFGLRCQKVSEALVKQKVEAVLELVSLRAKAFHEITKLSGGEQQRVALVRALVNKPKLLLLDEPLGALDLKLRLQLQQELVSIQKKFNTTFLFVTHDQQEALNMSDRVVLMNQGLIEQIGSPHEIYETPKSYFAAQFVGSINTLEASMKEVGELNELKVNVEGVGEFKALHHGHVPEISKIGKLCVRPEKIMLYSKRPTTMANIVEGKIKTQNYLGTYTQFDVTLKNGSSFLIFQQNSLKLPKKVFKSDDSVYLGWQADASHFFEV